MGFGDCVGALLETYSKCLDLLKAFRRNSDDASSDASSILQRSIRSDRSKVRRAYASRLSRDGRRLEKGDSRSRSSLSQIVKKLNAAIVELLHVGKKQTPVLDYESLLRLSNSSRLDAISTIDQLSQRLGGSPSRRSLKSTSSSSSSGSSKSSSSKRHGGRRPEPSAAKPDSSKRPAAHRAETKPPTRKISSEGPSAPVENAHGHAEMRDDRQARIVPQNVSGSNGRNDSNGNTRGDAIRNSLPNRMSLLSMSSDSTKLGEIPQRRLMRRRPHEYDWNSDNYNVRPTYPLKPYQPPEPRSRGFWGLFGR